MLNCSTNDTWLWNPATKAWTQAQANGAAGGSVNQPSQRAGAMMVFDSTRNQVVLFGGVQPATGTVYNDLWVYNFNASKWTQAVASNCASIALPSCRAYGAMARDNSGQIVLFGGYNGPALGDTWTLSGSTGTAYPLNSPPARPRSALAPTDNRAGGPATRPRRRADPPAAVFCALRTAASRAGRRQGVDRRYVRPARPHAG